MLFLAGPIVFLSAAEIAPTSYVLTLDLGSEQAVVMRTADLPFAQTVLALIEGQRLNPREGEVRIEARRREIARSSRD